MAKSSREGREELVMRVLAALSLATKKETEWVVDNFINCLEGTMLSHLDDAGFSLKLNGFAEDDVRLGPATSWGAGGVIGSTAGWLRSGPCGGADGN
jgi:hypothetical protein